jgi:hypothetical protein
MRESSKEEGRRMLLFTWRGLEHQNQAMSKNKINNKSLGNDF